MIDYGLYFHNSFERVLVFNNEGNLIYKNRLANKMLNNTQIAHFNEILDELKCGITFSDVKIKCKDGGFFSCVSQGININYSYAEPDQVYIMKINNIANVLDMNLAEDAADAFLVFNPDLNIIYVNKAVCKLLEIDKSDLLDKCYTDIFQDEHANLHPKISTMKPQEAFVIERKLKTRSGKIINVELNTKLFENGHYFTVMRDVSLRYKFRKELEQKNKKLEKSEQNYLQLFNNFPYGVLEANSKGIISNMNDKMRRILGSSSIKTSMKFNVLKTLEKRHPEMHKDMLKCFASGKNQEKIYNYKTIWGREVLAKTKFIPYKFYNENKIMILLEDYTKKDQENKLMRIFSKSLANSYSSVVVTDLKGKISFVNKRTEELTGYSKEELMGEHFADLVKAQHNKEAYKDLVETVRSDKSWQGELKNCKKDGSCYWANVLILHMKDEHDVVSNLIIIQEEITEKKKFEAKLKLKNQQMDVLLKNIPDMILLKGEKGEWLRANLAVLKSLGLPPDFDYHGKTNKELLPFCSKNKDTLFELSKDDDVLWKDKESKEFEIKVKDENNEDIIINIWRYPLFHRNGRKKGLISIGKNITKHKLYEANLRLAKEKAEQADKLKATFLSNMSHEIKTPLQAIQGFSSLLADYEFEREQMIKYQSRIKESSNELVAVIEDMLSYADLHAKKKHANHTTFNIIKLLNKLKNEAKKKIIFSGKKNIKVYLKNKFEGKSLELTADVEMFTDIFRRLLSNAIKFTEEGSITFGFSVENETDICCFVTDTGIGIDKKNHDSIFEPFKQIDESITRKYTGNGLGLAIAKCLIDLLDGKIWIESELDRGSTFYFQIPIIHTSLH